MLAGCAGPFSTLDPAGPAAASIARLWWIMLAGSMVLTALVMGLVGIAFLRSRPLRSTPHAAWLAGGGLVLPGIVLPSLLIYGLLAGERLFLADRGNAVEVEVLARQWAWEFSYPVADGPPRRSVGVLHIPAGTAIDLHVASDDVIHSFWVPRLAGKIDAIPGHVTRLRLVADRPGIYHGLCAEFCGLEHTRMRFEVRAHADRAGFEAAIAGAEGEAAP